jgi:hypothetical protein
MSQAKEYRAFAAQCMRVARSAVSEAERTRCLDMAQQWMRWAETEQKKEKTSEPSNGDRSGNG